MENMVKVARALGDPIRYRIMLMIARNEGACCRGLCNCEIQAATGMIQSRVSYHMRQLVDAGLVHEQSRGKWKFYSLERGALERFVRRLEEDFRREPDQGQGGRIDE